MTLFEPIFDALNEAQVRYVVVGGVAVVLRGNARLTADLDIAVDLDPDQAGKAIRALTSLGLRPRIPVDAAEFSDPAARESWARDKGMTVFTLADPDDPFRSVDLFIENPIDFEELWARSDIVDLDSTEVRVASTEPMTDATAADGWERHRREQAAAQSLTTPAQRLRWLEEAIEFARRAGALPRPSAQQADEPGADRPSP